MSEPLAIVLLLVATGGISIWGFQDKEIEERYIFRPERILADKEYYRLVSCAFLHSGWAHLLLNMYTLYGFGGVVARWFGQGHFLGIYFASVVGGSLLSLYLHRHHDYAAYGASGGVCGIIFAYVLIFPNSRLALFPLPYAVPAWLYALGFVIGSFYAMQVQKDNIGHDAHLGGAIIGLLVTAQLHPSLVHNHWQVFTTLLLSASLVFLYLLLNPLSLPLSAVLRFPDWSLHKQHGRGEPSPKSRTQGGHSAVVTRQSWQEYQRLQEASRTESDWLLPQLEVHLGKLERDSAGLYDWIDKFGRSYAVVGGRPEYFRIEHFTKAVLEHLRTPNPNFVVVDTSELLDSQIDQIRPVLADLPDHQFNRIIRSYGFNPRQQP